MLDEIMKQRHGPDWREFLRSDGRQTTPVSFNGAMRAFARNVGGPRARIALVPVAPIGPEQRCFANVRDYVAQHGGAIIYGWVIWQSGSFVEAEFHAIVQDSKGNMFCVTQHRDGEDRIAFIPDGSGRQPAFEDRGTSLQLHTYFNASVRSGQIHERVMNVDRKDYEPITMVKVSL